MSVRDRPEYALGQASQLFGQLQLRGRVVEDVVLAGQPFEEGLQGGQHPALAAVAQGAAVAFAVVVEMALITLQDRLGHFLGSVQVSLVAPADKASQGGLAALEGILALAFDLGRRGRDTARSGPRHGA